MKKLDLLPGDWVTVDTREERRICEVIYSNSWEHSACRSTAFISLKAHNELPPNKCIVTKINLGEEAKVAESAFISIELAPKFLGKDISELTEYAQIKCIRSFLQRMCVPKCPVYITFNKWKLKINSVFPTNALMVDKQTRLNIWPYPLEIQETRMSEIIANIVVNMEIPINELDDRKKKCNCEYTIAKYFVQSILRNTCSIATYHNFIRGDSKSYEELRRKVLLFKMCRYPRPRISLVVYNADTFILKELDNLVNQNDDFSIIATTNSSSVIMDLKATYTRFHIVNFPVLDYEKRVECFTEISKNITFESDVDWKEISLKTNGFNLTGLFSVICYAYVNAALDVSKKGEIIKIKQKNLADGLNISRKYFTSKSKMLNIQDSDFSSIGGLEEIKKRLKRSLEYPIIYKKRLSNLGIKIPHGVLLHGPPGCSKTSLVKAIASSSNMNFFSLDGSTLYSQYVGESERILRETFGRARDFAPSIIFIDEIDTVVGKRDASSSATRNKVQDGIISTILNEMDGITTSGDVVVVGATNKPENVDMAIMRPGRFDLIINVPLPNENGRMEVIKIYTKKMTLADDVILEDLAKKYTVGFTGAEIELLCREAALLALKEVDEIPTISARHFERALASMRR